MRVTDSNGEILIAAGDYRLALRRNRPTAMLLDPNGEAWAELRLLASVDTLTVPDETTAVTGPSVTEVDWGTCLRWRLACSAWTSKSLVIDCRERDLQIRVEVEGSGRPTDVTLLGGSAAMPNGASGSFWSGARFNSLFSPAPSDPGKVVLSASRSTDISAAGGSEHGRGQWFFTPAPFLYAVSRAVSADPLAPPPGPWLTFGLVSAPEEQRFLGVGYRASDFGFRFVLDYEGHTQVDGAWRSPSIVIAAATDPYAGLTAHRERLEAAGLLRSAPIDQPDRSRPAPSWWRQPMFCGWGAQSAMATAEGLPMSAAPGFATQANYDRFLDHLEDRGVVPGTIVIDDKWQAAYGTCTADSSKWPDLRGWIASRRERGQRILLWWKAWDPEGLPPEWCVRTFDGMPIAIDPNHPDARDAIRKAIMEMLAPGKLAADGLKIDFTARTPSGATLRHQAGTWGVALLRLLLETVRAEAKRQNPNCLLVGQVVEPSIAPLLDMIRLNDMLRLDDPRQPGSVVRQMAYRGAVVRAACPGQLIDTDDWCAPDLAAWREYAEVKPELGVPALYYASRLDLSGETLENVDYALIRRTWADYRAAQALPEPTGRG